MSLNFSWLTFWMETLQIKVLITRLQLYTKQVLKVLEDWTYVTVRPPLED